MSLSRSALREWLNDPDAQRALTNDLTELTSRHLRWVQRQAEVVAADNPQVPAALARVAIAAALRDAAADLLTMEAALARRTYPLTAIAEASGMEPTSSPARNFRGFRGLVSADDAAAQGGGRVQGGDGRRLRLSLPARGPAAERWPLDEDGHPLR